MSRIVITGGAGSLGKEFVKYCLDRGDEVTVVDQSEWAVAELNRNKPDNLTLILGDYTDVPEGDLLVHTAAYKHVDLGESNHNSFYKNNVLNLGKMLIDCKSPVIFISTDKAVENVSFYGQTKFLGEAMVQEAGGVIIRFGNIFSSSGSCVPLWEKAIAENRPLPITDWDMKRYFITAEDAVARIMALYPHAKGGDVIIPEMGKEVSLREIVNQVLDKHGKSHDYPVEIIGLRPGEKLQEKLHWDSEKVTFENEHGRIYRSINNYMK